MSTAKHLPQSGRVDLTAEECYSDIPDFYRLVAAKMGYEPDNIIFDSRKICVSKAVMAQIFAFYMEEHHLSKGAVSKGWLAYGPKANIPEESYVAVIDEGFISEVAT